MKKVNESYNDVIVHKRFRLVLYDMYWMTEPST